MLNLRRIREMLRESQRRDWGGHVVVEKLEVVLKYARGRILDAGCGKGSYTLALREFGYNIMGVDLLPELICQKREMMVADIHHLPLRNKYFDTILLLDVLEHLDNERKALSEVYRVCKAKGILIFSVPVEPSREYYKVFREAKMIYWHWIDRTHKRAYEIPCIENLLNEIGFKIFYMKFIFPIIPEIVVLHMYGLPFRLSVILGRLFSKIPIRRKFFMTVIGVARKQGNYEDQHL
jgi:SAM-dependent methyltransferase